MSMETGNAAGMYFREGIAELRKSLRLPQFVLPTVGTPALFYGLFALALNQRAPAAAAYSLATFGVFAAAGPALFGFGAGVAVERESGLIELKRVSPLPGLAYATAKLISAGFMAFITLAIIYAFAVGAGVRLSSIQWMMLIGIHLFSVAPYALIGFAIGMRLGSKGAIATANALYIGLSLIGGLWLPISLLPKWIQMLAWLTPSYHLAQLSLTAIRQPIQSSPFIHLACIVGMTAAAAWLAEVGWQRAPT